MVKILNRHDLEVRNQKDHYQKQFEASSLNKKEKIFTEFDFLFVAPFTL